jgi:CheY-like chemotaxis protein/anti-sigma regulatory factor (Ser/Thr protein kinase)
MQLRVSEKALQLKTSVGVLPPHLYGDSVRLRQALLNYSTNAVKFTSVGSIALKVTVQEEHEQDVLVRLEVQDTGIGIDAVKLEKIFEAFEQADKTTARRYGGTGLGLAITKRFAQLMGGDAGASSTPGRGSVFWFTARLRKGASAHAPEQPVPVRDVVQTLRQAHHGKRVLLVDDDEINREIGKVMLEDVDLVVDLAEDGQMAVEQAKAHAYDLILMDMQMPLLDGLDATRAIRKLPVRSTVPVVAMTANAFTEDKTNCLQSGMNDFITKPIEPQALYATVLKWLSV